MCMNLNYAMKLEHAFERFYSERQLTHDSFDVRLTEAIREGFEYLHNQHIVSLETCNEMCKKYDFGDASLEEITKTTENTDKLDQLLDFLDATWKHQEKLNK